MEFLKLYLLLMGLASATALVTVEVELVSYRNPTSEDCDGGNCEGLAGTCDNQFNFCVREVGSSLCLVTLSSDEIENDDLSFTIAQLGELGISNPLRFTSVPTRNPLEFFVEVTDIDLGTNDPVDMITVPIPRNLKADGQQTPARVYLGSCGRASIQVRISITSDCPPNTFGPQCSRQCVESGRQRICNYLGEPTCLGNFRLPDCNMCITGFQGPNCTECAPNYYPAGVCRKFCIPTDDSTGHYTCDSNGDRVCLPRYKIPDNNCVMCVGNFREPNCVGCDANFRGTNCDMCEVNLYPQGVCDTFCQPRNDANGHYTCDDFGNKVCLPGYTDASTDCVRCIGNRQEPDCSACDTNYQPPTCTACVSGYTSPSTGCRTCAGNFKAPGCTECTDNFVGANCDQCAPDHYPPEQCFCTPRNNSGGHFTCNTVTGEKTCLEGYRDPDSNCVQLIGPTAREGGSSNNDGFVGSTAFIAIIAVVVAVPLASFLVILCIFCVLCLLSSNVDCSCPKIDCENCCDSFFKSLSCGFKCDDCNPIAICAIVVLGILAAPAIILIGAVVIPIFLIGACLLYSLAHICDS